MPGANYMGGRRNIVKARAKDAIARQQKSHFGRQRLDILARGVSALRPSELAKAIPTSASVRYQPSVKDIDLAHAHAEARTKLPVRHKSESERSVERYIPKPVHVVPGLRSPRSRASMRTPASLRSDTKTRSAVCDALDMSDPAFMRRIMDEILAMPDLAGLGKYRQTAKSKKTEQPVTTSQTPGRKRYPASSIDNSPGLQTRDEGVFISYSNGKQHHRHRTETPLSFQNSAADTNPSDYDVDFGQHPGASSIRSPLTPYSCDSRQVHQYNADSPGPDSEHNHDETELSYNASDRARSNNSSHRSEFSSRSFHDSGFSEFEARPDSHIVGTSSPSWSTRFEGSYPDSSPRSIARFLGVHDDDWTVDTTEREQGGYPEDSGFRSDVIPAVAAGIPKVIEFGQPNSQRKRSGRRPSVYGALFEQQDPWRTIGVILGLEEDGMSGDEYIPSIKIDGCRSAEVEVSLEADHDQPFGKTTFSDGDEEDAIWEEGEDVNDMDWDCRFSTLSKVDRPGQGQLEQSPLEMLLNSRSSTPDVDALPETTTDIRAACGGNLDADADDAYDKPVDDDNELYGGIHRPSMIDMDDDTCDGMPVDVEHELNEASEAQEGRVLDVPTLEEIDGKFIGPALFGEDFSSSDSDE